jgi:NADPH:quinone reductase-like Zn-dependent oxidoreductase
MQPLPDTMLRYYRNAYGNAAILQLQESALPVPKKDEVIVQVAYTGVNRTDSGFLTGLPKFARLIIGWPKPKARVLGCEFSGRVVGVGKEVKRFSVGDRVVGFDDSTFGGFAQYMAISENKGIVHLPEAVDFQTAASLTEGSHYALVDLRAANIGQGSRVLVYGASGAIGSAAVQLAKAMGAFVVAVAGTQAREAVATLGADELLDYEKGEFDTHQGSYDLVLDAVGKSSWKRCRQLLAPSGCYISTELGKNAENPFLALYYQFRKIKKVKFPIPYIRQDDINWLATLANTGKFKPLLDRVYAFSDLPKAMEYVLSGQKTGNVVVKIADD